MRNFFSGKIPTLFSLCLVVFIDFLGYGIILPVLTPLFFNVETGFLPENYSEETRTFLFGMVVASYAIAQFFGAPIIGALSDRYGRKKMLTITLTGSLIANLGFIFGTLFSSVSIMIAGRLIGGFMGGNAALANTMIGDISEDNEKSKNYGFVGLALALGIVLGPYIGAQLADPNFIPNASLRTPFYFASLISFLAILFVVFFVQETIHESINRKAPLLNGFKQIFNAFHYKNLRTIFIMTFLLVFSFNLFVYSLNIYLFQRMGFTEKELGNYLAYAGLCLTIVLGFINPIIAKKYKPAAVLRISLLLLGIAFVLSIIPRTFVGLYTLTPFLALGYGLSQANLAALLSSSTSMDEHGEAFGVNQSLTAFVEGITPLFASLLLAINLMLPNMFSYTLPTIFSAISALICWVIFVFNFNKNKIIRSIR
jgi:DHA1 family tetracycline resistance protein-like MFS transporter